MRAHKTDRPKIKHFSTFDMSWFQRGKGAWHKLQQSSAGFMVFKDQKFRGEFRGPTSAEVGSPECKSEQLSLFKNEAEGQRGHGGWHALWCIIHWVRWESGTTRTVSTSEMSWALPPGQQITLHSICMTFNARHRRWPSAAGPVKRLQSSYKRQISQSVAAGIWISCQCFDT